MRRVHSRNLTLIAPCELYRVTTNQHKSENAVLTEELVFLPRFFSPMHHSVNPSSRLGVAGALQHFFYLYVFYIRLLKCAVHGHAAFGETQWPDHKAHRLDHVAQYEIIIPQWMSPARQKRSPSSNKPPPDAEIKITAEGKELVLRLERNEQLFAPEYTETWYSPSGALLSSSPQNAEHCFYHGAVRGQEGSGVALSTCHGLRGLITVNHTVSYLIEPLPNGTDADQHAVYRVESLRLQQGTCGHRHGDHTDRLEDIIAGLIHTEQHGREKRDLRKNTKYVELMIVADNAEFQKHGRDFDKTRMKLLEAANYVDKFYKALNIRVALIGLEIWTDQDKISVSDNPFSTLCAFLDWRRKQLPRLKNDNAQLVTGVPFQGSTIGLAPLKAMCSEYQSGGVNSDHSHVAIGVAATMAHEMGHNFGMSHDISGCCMARPEDGGCIMASATGHPFPRVFNRCNERELERYLGSGGGKCLFNPPNTDAMYGGRRCGNGYLEEGEECDCGEEEECSSPCCNANNCTLRAGAECAHGVCCHNCKLKSPGVLCREPSGQCDLPEYCDGTSEFCPANFYLMDGTSCEGGRAYCYTGMCLTLEQQCLLLWGPGARPAPDPCFEKVNVAGDQYGNCGKDLMGKYRRCESRHAKCGKIQCQSSAAKPLETNAVSIDTTITLNGQQFKCRGTHVYPMGQGDESVGDTLDPGLVMTGTKCGEREICFEGQCRNSSFLQADDCRTKCNGHGLCNNNHNCHCDAGWAPPFCDQKGTGGSLDSGSITTHSSLLPVLLLLPLLLAAGLAAVGLWCCYKHRLHPLKKSSAPPLEAPQTR
nr:PREDICTED: disintegrin and metalloproteinase domain-containing protein 19 isoform X1 [Lepisosteus oculatus]